MKSFIKERSDYSRCSIEDDLATVFRNKQKSLLLATSDRKQFSCQNNYPIALIPYEIYSAISNHCDYVYESRRSKGY